MYVYSIVSLAYASSEVSTNPWIAPELLKPELFMPSAADVAVYGQYSLSETRLFAKPADVPADYIAYNPSGVWTEKESGKNLDIMYVRVEPDRSSPGVSHLGKVVARPYIIDINNPEVPLKPYYYALELSGEDPSLTRINRRLPVSGRLQEVWLLGVVDAQPTTHAQKAIKELNGKELSGRAIMVNEARPQEDRRSGGGGGGGFQRSY